MRRLPPRLQRLVRTLLACWALLVVFEPPAAASASWELRALSAWMAPGGTGAGGTAHGAERARTSAGRVASRLVASQRAGSPQAASGVQASQAAAVRNAVQSTHGVSALTSLSLRAGATQALLTPRLDGRYLYLAYQSLLC